MLLIRQRFKLFSFQTIFVSNNSSPEDSILPFENALGNQVWETWVWKLSVSHSISKCIFKWQNRVLWTQIVRNENSLKGCQTNKIVWGIWLFFLKIPTPLFQTLHIQILDALSSLPILLFLLLRQVQPFSLSFLKPKTI